MVPSVMTISVASERHVAHCVIYGLHWPGLSSLLWCYYLSRFILSSFRMIIFLFSVISSLCHPHSVFYLLYRSSIFVVSSHIYRSLFEEISSPWRNKLVYCIRNITALLLCYDVYFLAGIYFTSQADWRGHTWALNGLCPLALAWKRPVALTSSPLWNRSA